MSSKTGRPSKLDAAIVAKIMKAVEAGNALGTAAEAAGIASSTLFKWLARVRAGDPAFAEFSESLRKALAAAEVEFVNVVKQAALDGDYRAATWWLERRRHSRWRSPQSRETSKIEIRQDSTITPDGARRAELCAELARRGESLSPEQLRMAASWNTSRRSAGDLS